MHSYASACPTSRLAPSRTCLAMGRFTTSTHRAEAGTGSKCLARNKSSYSIHLMAFENGRYLAESYADKLGKAKVGKGCIRFSSLDDLNQKALAEVLRKASVCEFPTRAGNQALVSFFTSSMWAVPVRRDCTRFEVRGAQYAGRAPYTRNRRRKQDYGVVQVQARDVG